MTSVDKQPQVQHLFLWCELLVLYVGLPFLLFKNLAVIRSINGGGSFFIILLPIMALLMIILLMFKQVLTYQTLFSRLNAFHHLRNIGLFFLPFAIITSVAVYFWQPNLLFKVPKENPLLWVLIIIFYPLLSVCSQGIIYRYFFFKRYQILFTRTWVTILVSACCFSFGHIIFGNYLAPLLTFFGGILFAWRYQHTQSWLLSNFEHSLYGVWLFTVGLGQFLYSGS